MTRHKFPAIIFVSTVPMPWF